MDQSVDAACQFSLDLQLVLLDVSFSVGVVDRVREREGEREREVVRD